MRPSPQYVPQQQYPPPPPQYAPQQPYPCPPPPPPPYGSPSISENVATSHALSAAAAARPIYAVRRRPPYAVRRPALRCWSRRRCSCLPCRSRGGTSASMPSGWNGPSAAASSWALRVYVIRPVHRSGPTQLYSDDQSGFRWRRACGLQMASCAEPADGRRGDLLGLAAMVAGPRCLRRSGGPLGQGIFALAANVETGIYDKPGQLPSPTTTRASIHSAEINERFKLNSYNPWWNWSWLWGVPLLPPLRQLQP